MPDYLFLFHLLLSFIFGGTMVATSIYVAKRFGIGIGAVVLTLPSTSLVSFLFIAITNSVDFLIQAIPFGILSLSATLIFVSVFIAFSEKLKKNALLAGLLVWGVLGTLIIYYQKSDLQLSVLIFFLTYLAVNAAFRNKRDNSKIKLAGKSEKFFFYRVLIAGTVISMAVLLAKLFGPVWGGLFSMFPAAFSSSFFMIQHDYGVPEAVAVARNTLPPLIIIVFYALLISVAYPALGIYIGTVAALVPTWLFAYIVYLINSKL